MVFRCAYIGRIRRQDLTQNSMTELYIEQEWGGIKEWLPFPVLGPGHDGRWGPKRDLFLDPALIEANDDWRVEVEFHSEHWKQPRDLILIKGKGKPIRKELLKVTMEQTGLTVSIARHTNKNDLTNEVALVPPPPRFSRWEAKT